MKKNIIFLLLILFALSCEFENDPDQDQGTLPLTPEYAYSFSTEMSPFALAINEENNNIYVANSAPYIDIESWKIQKFSYKGKLLTTVVEFKTFESEDYLEYDPIDICFHQGNLFVLAKPSLSKNDQKPVTYETYCILQFDANDNFIKEIDFLLEDEVIYAEAMAYYNGFILVTNGHKVKYISLFDESTYDITLPMVQPGTSGLPVLFTSDIVINSDGIIYLTGQAPGVTDSPKSHLTLYNPVTDEYITKYTEERDGDLGAMLDNPGLTISSDSNIYLATFYNMSLEIFNKEGELITYTDIRTEDGKDTRPIDVVVSNSRIYIADYLNNLVLVYD